MKGITIKLPEPTLARLRREARARGCSVASIIRERLESPPQRSTDSVYALISDLVGRLDGPPISATNQRRKFRRP